MPAGLGQLTVNIKAEVEHLEAGLVAAEPILVGHAALWLVAMVGEFLVGHTHLVTAHQWDGLQSTLIQLVTTVLLAVSAGLMRSVVTPAAKYAEHLADDAKKALDDATIPLGSVQTDLKVDTTQFTDALTRAAQATKSVRSGVEANLVQTAPASVTQTAAKPTVDQAQAFAAATPNPSASTATTTVVTTPVTAPTPGAPA